MTLRLWRSSRFNFVVHTCRYVWCADPAAIPLEDVQQKCAIVYKNRVDAAAL